mgnify:CR=1 FL=1
MEYQGNLRIKVNPEDKEEYEVFSGDNEEHRFAMGFSGVRNWDIVVNELNQRGLLGGLLLKQRYIQFDLFQKLDFMQVLFMGNNIISDDFHQISCKNAFHQLKTII